MKYLVALLMGFMFVGCGEDEGEPAEGDRSEQIAALSATATAGETTYTQVCAVCHGPDGTGTATGNSLVESNFTKSMIIDIIIEGQGDMSSYASLPDQDIANVTAYVMLFQE